MNSIVRPTLNALVVAMSTALPLCAQLAEVPRTPTLPGIEDPAFPYALPEDVGLSDSALRSLGHEVAGWVAEGEIIGAEVLIIKDGKAAFHEAIGWNDRERKTPLQRNSIYRMRSMTKPLVGTAVLMLMEEGEFSLDAAVATILPSFDTERARSITIRELLTHTSGLGNHGEDDIGLPRDADEYETLRTLVDDVGRIGILRTPGRFYYSDSGSATLGAIVAEVAGMPVEEFIEARILVPLRMVDTHTRFTTDAPWATRMNNTYRWSDRECAFSQYWNPTMEQGYRYFRASGGLYSTTMDYARFMSMWMNKGRYGDVRLLSEATVKAALRPIGDRGDGRRYGMHWTIRNGRMEDDLPAMFGHGGSDGTMAFAFPALDSVVLYFTQSRNRSARDRFLFALGRMQPFNEYATSRWNTEVAAAWERLQARTAPLAEVAPELLQRYVGSYVHEDEVGKVFADGDTLFYVVPGVSAPVPLQPLSETSFMAGHCGLVFRVTFLVGSDGMVGRHHIETRNGWEGVLERQP